MALRWSMAAPKGVQTGSFRGLAGYAIKVLGLTGRLLSLLVVGYLRLGWAGNCCVLVLLLLRACGPLYRVRPLAPSSELYIVVCKSALILIMTLKSKFQPW